MDDFWTRIVENMASRVTGPMKFRLVLQPLMASIFAIRSGLADARTGKPPYSPSFDPPASPSRIITHPINASGATPTRRYRAFTSSRACSPPDRRYAQANAPYRPGARSPWSLSQQDLRKRSGAARRAAPRAFMRRAKAED